MPIKSLTKRFLDSLQPNEKTTTYTDKNIRNLILRHYPTNKKSFYVSLTINGIRTYRFIGTYPILEPEHVKNIVKMEVSKFFISSNKAQYKEKSKYFRYYMDAFVNEHLPEVKVSTQILYNRLIRNHLMPTFQDFPIKDIEYKHILYFKQKLYNKTTTYNRCHQLLSVFFNYCVTHAIISKNPLGNIKKYKEHHRTGCFSPEQYQSFIKSTYHLLEQEKISKSAAGALLFLLLTGCRLGEALTAKWSYVDFKGNIIKLPDSKTGAKTLYMGTALKEILQSFPKIKNNDYIFTGRHGRSHLVNLTKPFKRILLHANIKEHFTIHHLRHSFISIAANSGIPLNAVQKAVGHASQATTERYTHTDSKLAAVTAQTVENIITTGVLNKVVHSMA